MNASSLGWDEKESPQCRLTDQRIENRGRFVKAFGLITIYRGFLFMGKTDLFMGVLEAVCKAFGMDEGNVLGSKKEESVDARSVLIEVLSSYLTDEQIGRLIGKDRRSVNYLRNRFRERSRKWSVRVAYEEVNEYLCGRIFKSHNVMFNN